MADPLDARLARIHLVLVWYRQGRLRTRRFSVTSHLLASASLCPSLFLPSFPLGTMPRKWQNVGSCQCHNQLAPFGINQMALANIWSWKTKPLFPVFSPLSWHPWKSAFVSISSVWGTLSKHH